MVTARTVGVGRCWAGAWALAAAIAVAGCASGTQPVGRPTTGTPMNRPVALGSDGSTGATEAARRELQGTWDLAALEYAASGDAPRVPVKAAGTLTYDEFGNLTMDVSTTDPAAPVAAREVSRLSFRGRAVIDPAKRELKLMDLTGNANPDEVLAPERRRRFEVQGDVLKLSSFDGQGRVTAITTWRRRS
jgi:hypothetical protein